MAEFTAKVLGRHGVRKLKILADSREEAVRIATREGRLLSVTAPRFALDLAMGTTAEERVMFLQRLSTMVRSRVGMGESLKVMRSAFTGSIRRLADTLLRRIEAGSDFGDAIDSLPPRDMPRPTAALIRSGARSGDLGQALLDAAKFELEMKQIKSQSSKGLMSAITGYLLGSAMIIALSVWVGPYMMESDLIKSHEGDINVDWVFAITDGTAVVIGILTAIFLVMWFWSTAMRKVAPGLADRVILKIPYYRDLVMAREHYTSFYGLAMLVRSGVRIEEALKLAALNARRGEIRADLDRAYEAVKGGRPWAEAMRHLHATDIAALSTAQDRAQVAEALDAVSQQHKETYAQRIRSFVPALELSAALLMTVGGGLMFGMIIMPMLQLTSVMM